VSKTAITHNKIIANALAYSFRFNGIVTITAVIAFLAMIAMLSMISLCVIDYYFSMIFNKKQRAKTVENMVYC